MRMGFMHRAPGRDSGFIFLWALSGLFPGVAGVDVRAQEASSPAYAFQGRAEIQSLGLSFPTFDGAGLKDLPPPRARLVETDAGVTKDAYRVWDVWFRRQWLAQWTAATGESMILAEARRVLPEQAMGAWVTDAAYQEVEQKYGVAVHQYLFYAFPGERLPVWFHEAHATFIEGAERGRTGWTLGEAERFPGRIDAWVKSGTVDFGPLLQLEDETFYGGGNDARSRNYAMAWALAYYLHKGGPSDRTSPGSGLMKKLLNEAKENGIHGAQEKIFDAATVQAVNADFIKFWKNPGRRSAARKFDPTRGG